MFQAVVDGISAMFPKLSEGWLSTIWYLESEREGHRHLLILLAPLLSPLVCLSQRVPAAASFSLFPKLTKGRKWLSLSKIFSFFNVPMQGFQARN